MQRGLDAASCGTEKGEQVEVEPEVEDETDLGIWGWWLMLK